MPEISIVTATYNSSGTLPVTIDSIAEQKAPLEQIFIDGGSTDNTLSIIADCSSHRTKHISEPDLGIYDAINKGIELAKGQVIGVVHSDDFLADQEVLSEVQQVFEDPRIEAVYGDLEYVDRIDSSRTVRRWQAGEFSRKRIYQGWMPPHPTFFVRRECYEKFGQFRLDLGTAADYELMLRFLLVHKISVEYIPRVLVKMRVGGASNANLKARLRANRMDRKAWDVNGLKPYPWTLLAKPVRKIGQWWIR
jgi:glycosyltransferase